MKPRKPAPKKGGTSFHSEDIWPQITALCKSGRGHVAVAFLGKGSYKLLPLSAGSVLVVNASLDSVRRGLTNPSELIKFVKKKVKVHTAQDLHAKVFAFPRRVVIGSANASKSSARYWQEAAVASSEKAIIDEARSFVQWMSGERLTLKDLRALAKKYRPPKADQKSRRTSAKRKAGPERSPLWIAKMERGDWDAETHRNADRARPSAKARLEPDETLDEFRWAGGTRVLFKLGEQVVQIVEEEGRKYVYPPARVLGIRRFTSPMKDELRAVVFAGRPKELRRKLLSPSVKRLGPEGAILSKRSTLHRVRSRPAAQALRQLWSDS